MNYYTTSQNLIHIESELRSLQFELLQKRKERKHEEVEALEILIDDLHLKFINLKNQSEAES